MHVDEPQRKLKAANCLQSLLTVHSVACLTYCSQKLVSRPVQLNGHKDGNRVNWES